MYDASNLKKTIATAEAEIEKEKVSFPQSYNGIELLNLDLPALTWFVDGLLPQGLFMLAGPPKIGKSFLTLDMFASISCGMPFLGRETKRCKVFYLALEDSWRRVQHRYQKLMTGNESPTENFIVSTEWPRMDKGGIPALHLWLDKNPDVRVVALDVFARVRGASRPGQNIYEADYNDMALLHRLATERGLSILLVHHFNKVRNTENIQDRISGSSGIAGGVDGYFCMSHGSESDTVLFSVSGRDVEPVELTLKFNKEAFCFECLGDTKELQRSTAEKEVLKALDEPQNKQGLSGESLRSYTGLATSSHHRLLVRMVDTGRILRKVKGRIIEYRKLE